MRPHMESHKRMRRGIDGETSIRIRYRSPPRRSEDDATAMLAEGRGIGRFRPRHTPPDASAAQDVALKKAEVLTAAIEAAKTPKSVRRDSGMNYDGTKDEEDEAKTHVSDSEDEDRFEPELPSPKLPFRAPPAKANGKRTSAQAATPSDPTPVVTGTRTPSLAVKPAIPELQSSLSSQATDFNETTSSRRRTRTSIRDDLKIDGTSKLDLSRPDTDFEEVKLYKGTSRAGTRWFEWTGEGRPEWALDEKVERRPVPKGRRRESSWLKNRTD